MCGEVYQNELKYDPETGEPLIDGYPLYSGLPKSTLADDGNTGVASDDESNTDADTDRLREKKKQIYEDLKGAVDREWVGLKEKNT